MYSIQHDLNLVLEFKSVPLLLFSVDEDGQRGASMISRLPQYPTLNTDVMGGNHCFN